MSEVQKLKREVCAVEREKGGNEVSKEASAFLSIGVRLQAPFTKIPKN